VASTDHETGLIAPPYASWGHRPLRQARQPTVPWPAV